MLNWRPQTRVVNRLGKAATSVVESPNISRWLLDYKSSLFMTSLFCDVNFENISSAQKQVYADFFQEGMYFNRYLDLQNSRARHGERSMRFLEEFWNMPERVKTLKEKALRAGYSEPVVKTIDNWFDINRVLNFCEKSLSEKGEIRWDDFAGDHVIEKNHTYQSIKRIIEAWKGKDKVSQAIMLRVISSMGFGSTLLALATNQVSNCREYQGQRRRTGSMVMVTQTIDDFATVSKDLKANISGIIKTALPDLQSEPDGSVRMSPADAKKAINIARQIFAGCVDEIGVDEQSRAKQCLTKYGLITLAGATYAAIHHKYKGTHYPFFETARSVLSEALGPKTRGEYSHITALAIEESLRNL